LKCRYLYMATAKNTVYMHEPTHSMLNELSTKTFRLLGNMKLVIIMLTVDMMFFPCNC